MSEINPYELLYMSRQEDEYAFRALFKQFRTMVVRTASAAAEGYVPLRPYKDDIIQEGLFAFTKAVDGYREDKNASPATYFQLLARRRVWNVCKHYSRGYGNFNGETISLDQMVADDERVFETIAQTDRMNEPEYALHYNLALEELNKVIGTMNESELEAVRAWASGEPYQEGADRLGISMKTWDGRRLRARRKISKAVFKG